jgi:hypothetical protein
MDKLRSQAEEAGGTVLSVLGNHEWMNAIGTTVSFVSSDVLIPFPRGLEVTATRQSTDCAKELT